MIVQNFFTNVRAIVSQARAHEDQSYGEHRYNEAERELVKRSNRQYVYRYSATDTLSVCMTASRPSAWLSAIPLIPLKRSKFCVT